METNKPNHTCAVCGKQYYACRDCDRRKTWKSTCDNPRHYQIYITVVQYLRGMIDKETARGYLEHVDVSKEEAAGFVASVRDAVVEILTDDAADVQDLHGAEDEEIEDSTECEDCEV